MNKQKSWFLLLLALGLIAIFLPWMIMDNDSSTGFSMLIGNLFSLSSVSSMISGLILGNFYVIGLILLVVFFFNHKKKIFVYAILLMILGLLLDYFIIGFHTFGGDVEHSIARGVGYWLAVYVTLIYLAWGLKKLPFQK